MKTSKRELKAMQQDVRHGPDRSTLYRWMVDHHAELLAEGSGGRMPWQKLCARFIAKGLADGQGKPPTPLRASRTWREASKEAQALAERAREAALRPSPPSRQRTDWQPPSARAAQPSTPRTSPPPAVNPIPSREGDEHLPAEVRAKLAAIDSQFEYLDRHIIRPPKRS
jgi:hypothetical protein